MTTQKKRVRWYYEYFYFCRICGRRTKEREARYDVKPESYDARHEIINEMYHCEP